MTGLGAAAEYNGKTAVVKGELTANGRQNVQVEGSDMNLLLKVVNMVPEPREAGSLSVRECIQVLRAKKLSVKSQASGMDKAQLQDLVRESVGSDDSLSVLIARGMGSDLTSAGAKSTVKATPIASSPAAPAMSEAQLRQGAEQMAAMDPAAMKSQAAMLRNMDPAAVRRMNPQMVCFTDAQIKEAADQVHHCVWLWVGWARVVRGAGSTEANAQQRSRQPLLMCVPPVLCASHRVRWR
jgi:hypothetical protein